jgi:hypothetical protein
LAAGAWVPGFLAQRTSPLSAAQPAPAAALPARAAPSEGAPAEPVAAAETEDEPASPAASNGGARKTRRAQPQRAPVPVKPATAAAAATRAGCNPPYYFSAGIKTYKPECI